MSDWYPTKRTEILIMTKNWLSVFNEKAAAQGAPGGGTERRNYEAWGIPESALSELRLLCGEAERALSLAQNAETRTTVSTAACRSAFAALERFMRDIKDRYLKKPPLTDADFAGLGIKPRDTTPTPIRAPSGQAEADVSYPGPHLLAVHIRPLAGTSADPKADYGCALHWGIMPHGGASVEEAVGERRYLMKRPVSGAELPHSKFTRRKKETFDFPPEDSGKTAFFCARLENSKGDKGPWGPIVSVVIP